MDPLGALCTCHAVMIALNPSHFDPHFFKCSTAPGEADQICFVGGLHFPSALLLHLLQFIASHVYMQISPILINYFFPSYL